MYIPPFLVQGRYPRWLTTMEKSQSKCKRNNSTYKITKRATTTRTDSQQPKREMEELLQIRDDVSQKVFKHDQKTCSKGTNHVQRGGNQVRMLVVAIS